MRGYFRGKAYPFRGRTMTLYEIAREVGMPTETLRQRVLKIGLSVAEAVKVGRLPARRQSRLYLFRGECLSIRDHAAQTGISTTSLRARRCGDRIMEADEARAANALVRQPPDNACLVTHGCQTMSIADWSRKTGIDQKTLAARLGHYEWPVDRALTTPVDPIRAAPHVRRRNRRVISRVSHAIHLWRADMMGIRVSVIMPAPTTIPITGGYIQTSTHSQSTGGDRHETHFDGDRP